jgi:hypothetical protein
LFTKPQPEPPAPEAETELNVPAPIRTRGLDANKDAYYGADKSFAIWAEWAGYTLDAPVPSSVIVTADLSNWQYAPPDNSLAVDPRLGRIAFPINQLPERHILVSYQYGFSADVGAGEYSRVLSQPAAFELYTVGRSGDYKSINEALTAWKTKAPRDAVIEIGDSGIYVEQINIVLQTDQTLEVRAANERRPVIRLLNWQTDLPDAFTVRTSAGSCFTLDGIMVTGRGLSVTGDPPAPAPKKTAGPSNRDQNPRNATCPSEIVIRHCTLVPGWSVDCDCHPASPNKASLELHNVRAKVTIENSILGPIQVQEDETQTDPIPMCISDSIVDAMEEDGQAISGPLGRHAYAVLTIRRCTVFGIIQSYALELAENSIFDGCVHVARRSMGCVRFCYVPAACRTPKRFHCQPDLVIQTELTEHAGEAPAAIAAAQARATARVRPQFTARLFGTPGYCQLSRHGADEIARGADDASEMGVFHDLFQPQRLANLRARLNDFTPAGCDADVLLAN